MSILRHKPVQGERPEPGRGGPQHFPAREWTRLAILAKAAHEWDRGSMTKGQDNVKDTKRKAPDYSRYRNSLLAINTRATLSHASSLDILEATEVATTFSIRVISSGRAGRP